MGGVNFKSELSSNNVNLAFLAKNDDDITQGKLGLNKPAEGAQIFSAQKSFNELFDILGSAEGDVNSKTYANQFFIANGDNRKVVVEKLDASLNTLNTNFNDHVNSTSAHDADNLNYDNTVGDFDPSVAKIEDAIFENNTRVKAIEDGRGAADGYCPLNASTKIDTIYLPDSVLGAMQYQSAWNANTNTPTITSSVGTKGHYYVVNVAGTTNIDGTTDWEIGDWVVFNGTIWEKIDNSDKVSSVNGKVGVVVLDKTDIGLSNVTNDAQLKRSADDWNTFTNKTTPVDADKVLIEDSEDSNNKKTVNLENLLGGGGGGGSFIFELNGDSSPFEESVNGISVLSFYQEDDNEIYALLTVPESYKTGKQIILKGLKYFCNAASGNVLFKTITQLLKAGQDMSSLPLVGHTSPNAEQTLTTANELIEVGDLELSSASGEINSVAISPNDTLLVRLLRDNTNETSSATADAKLLKYSASVKFDA